MANTCEIPKELVAAFRKFKVQKDSSNAAFISCVVKIDRESLSVVLDEKREGYPLEELSDDLPESAPRYIAYSYHHTHKDGRVSYPLIFIFYCPSGLNPELSMLYSTTYSRLVTALEIAKTFEVRRPEDINEEWLLGHLNK